MLFSTGVVELRLIERAEQGVLLTVWPNTIGFLTHAASDAVFWNCEISIKINTLKNIFVVQNQKCQYWNFDWEIPIFPEIFQYSLICSVNEGAANYLPLFSMEERLAGSRDAVLYRFLLRSAFSDSAWLQRISWAEIC